MTIPNQPLLPPETPLNEVERLFIEESPAGLWPENQDSNYGQYRRVITQPLDDAVGIVEELFNERFLDTASGYLSRWEHEMGLPKQTGKTDIQRRSHLAARTKKGAFTRARRDAIIQTFIQATFGESLALTPEGISLPAGGAILMADPAPVESLYRVYENILDFSYEIWIVNTVTPDLLGLQRELAHFTPSGYPFTIDNTKANIKNYHREIMTDGASSFYRLNTVSSVQEMSGGPGNLVVASGADLIAAPGLLDTAVDEDLSDNPDGALDLNGTGYASGPHSDVYESEAFSVSIIARPDVVDGATRTMVKKTASEYALELAGSLFRFGVWDSDNDVTYATAPTTFSAVEGSTYFVTGTYDGVMIRLYINGELVAFTAATGILRSKASNALIVGASSSGGPNWWNGGLDEFVYFGYPLSAERIKRHYETGINVG